MRGKQLTSLLLGAVLAAYACSDRETTGLEVSDPAETPTLAAPPGDPVTFTVHLPNPPIPNNLDCLSQTGEGIAHFNRCEFDGPVLGDLIGDAEVVITGWQSQVTGEGQGRASFTLEGNWNGASGELTGNATFEWTLGISTGRLHARGTGGDFVGLQLNGTLAEQGDPPGGNSVLLVTATIR
ncbi:MAG: hypothetical protein GWN32_11255 [Gemmatimonadetes bacterium]|nr:hypothetical protein [Gemmatimonadota bacterium]